jgi:hypothetical protein
VYSINLDEQVQEVAGNFLTVLAYKWRFDKISDAYERPQSNDRDPGWPRKSSHTRKYKIFGYNVRFRIPFFMILQLM